MATRLGGLLHLREGGMEGLKGVAAAKESRRQHVRMFMFVHVENGGPSLVTGYTGGCSACIVNACGCEVCLRL